VWGPVGDPIDEEEGEHFDALIVQRKLAFEVRFECFDDLAIAAQIR